MIAWILNFPCGINGKGKEKIKREEEKRCKKEK